MIMVLTPQLLCHPGDCAPCTESEIVQCYCGADSQSATCGWNKDKEKECSGLPESGIETHWKGRYACERRCGVGYDCGVHVCLEVSYACLLGNVPVLHCNLGGGPRCAEYGDVKLWRRKERNHRGDRGIWNDGL